MTSRMGFLSSMVIALYAVILIGIDFADTLAMERRSQETTKIASGSREKLDQSEIVAIATRLSQTLGIRPARESGLPRSGLGSALRQNHARRIDLFDITRRNDVKMQQHVHWNEKNGTAVFVFGIESPLYKSAATSAMTPSETAIAFIISNQEVFRLSNPVDELLVRQELEDSLGKRHIVFQQHYRGIPVWGHELVAHLEPNGDLYLINGRYSPTPSKLDTNAVRISADQAVDIALEVLSTRTEIKELSVHFKRLLDYDGPKATFYIWVDNDTQEPHLVWHIQIRSNIRDNWYIFVDAVSGEILEFYNNTKSDGPATALAIDLNGINRTINVYQVGSPYYMIDATRPMWQSVQPDTLNDPKGALWTIDALNTDIDTVDNVSSNDNTWNDPTSVSAHYNVARTYEYYYSTFGRNAIDDSGSTIISIIHMTKDNQSFGGAFWNGQIMAYGDGDAMFKPLAGALDVVAHEMTHGVIQHTVNLEYKFQSGALNESFADVFGAMVDREDWLIGEDVVELAYFPSGAGRDMADPHNGGNDGDISWQPSHMVEFKDWDLEQDNGGVHKNSGIVNRAAYLIGAAIGKDKLEQMYYRILDARYLSRMAEFIDMRLAAIQAATDLYGAPSVEVDAVAAAFDAVGIYDGPGTEQPPDIEPVVGEEWVAVVNAEPLDNSLYLIKPDIPTSAINQLTSTQVFTGTGCPISVDREGAGIVFVDDANFIRAINIDGSGEAVISAVGEWRSVALSPDSKKLAATRIDADSTIYVFDLVNPDSSKAIHLYSPTTVEGTTSDITLYADALDWNLTGEYVLYDAFNSVSQAGDGAISYWDINVVQVASSIILPVFPPMPDGISMGNPAFASTNDVFLVFDLIDANAGSYYIAGVNLFTGSANVIEENGTSIGFPEFSADDSRIVFQRIVGSDKTLWQIAVDSTKILPSGPAEEWVIQGSLPTWFTIATVVDVDEPEEPQVLPETYSLSQNYPNPFNPSTTIKYRLPVRSHVQLSLYNVLGQKVRTLVDGKQAAGSHTVYWDGRDNAARPVSSGVYFYRIETESFVTTKKMVLLK